MFWKRKPPRDEMYGMALRMYFAIAIMVILLPGHTTGVFQIKPMTWRMLSAMLMATYAILVRLSSDDR